MTKLLTINSYDSLIYTFVDYLRLLGVSATVVRNDVVDLAPISSYDGVLASSDPGIPVRVGVAVTAIEQYVQTRTPMLGVCLGHQTLVEVFDGIVSHALTPVHRKTSVIRHGDRGFFEGFPSPLTVNRYHLLVAEPDTVRELVITTRTGDGVAMNVEHAELPLQDVQLHPESVLTQGGHQTLANWLAVRGQPEALEAARGKAPLIRFGERASQSHRTGLRKPSQFFSRNFSAPESMR